MDPRELAALIEAGLAGCEARVSGDGRHFDAVVVSEAFAGKSPVQRHRLVFRALGERFDGDILHALSLKTYTPEEFAHRGG